VWDFIMIGPDGTEYPNFVEWQEIVPPERIVYRHGERADDPSAFMTTVTLVDLGGATDITLRSVFKTKEQRDLVIERYHALEGARQTLGRLAELIATRVAGGQ
jgi:uncharacterized protein YndB with AHSA1/START domain